MQICIPLDFPSSGKNQRFLPPSVCGALLYLPPAAQGNAPSGEGLFHFVKH